MRIENISIDELQEKIKALETKLKIFGNVEQDIKSVVLELARAKELDNEAWVESCRRRLQDLKAQRASLRGLAAERLKLMEQLNAQTDPKSFYYCGLQPANFKEA